MVEAYPEDEVIEDGWGEGEGDGDGWDDDVEEDNQASNMFTVTDADMM